jgi:hypothetical protein
MRRIVLILAALVAIPLSMSAAGMCECNKPSWSTMRFRDCMETKAECVEHCGRVGYAWQENHDGCIGFRKRTYEKSRPSLKQHVKWAIFHEGCGVFAGDTRAGLGGLRNCFMVVESHNKEAKYQISAHDDVTLSAVVDESVAEIQAETVENFRWVCDHEQQGAAMHRLLAAGDIGAIRRVYSAYQQHNPNARNQLAAATDAFVRHLVANACPAVEAKKETRREREGTHKQ